MPASICDPVSNALRLSLSADESQNPSLLDSRLYSSAKNVLLSKIEFEESGDYQSNVLDGLKSKYVVIRPKKPILEGKHVKKESISNNQSSDTFKNEDGIPRPKRVLFPVEKVQLGWQSPWAAGAGMQNVGNTCYLNSTLQALFHVTALANWLVSESTHAENCNQQEACVICGMRSTLIATQKSGGAPIKPWQVYSKLRLICRHLTPGRQEDAHEFLRYLVEAMEKCYLSRIINSEKLDQYTKETTPLNQILGGYLRSTVRCLACHHLSTTYQHFQDLLLDIRKHSTLDDALDSFFSRERLEDLGYKCEACNKKVSATKQFLVERAPMVLCIALKRFSLAGGKLTKHVQFRKKISLQKYMYNKNKQQPLTYKLVSLVTHLGPSQNCGHYTAIGQAPNTNYYQFDDSCVRPLPLSAVLGTNAYIMFFEKEVPDESAAPGTTASCSNADHESDKSPLKLTFYRSDEKKFEATSSQPDSKPIILNSTLADASSGAQSEPWVVKNNGEVEKVSPTTKTLSGVDKPYDDKKISFVIKREESRRVPEASRTPDKVMTGSKLVRPPKSPLEKLEEQMKKCDGSARARLVPYESESSGDELASSAGPCSVCPHSLLNPSLHGVTNQKVKEKEERRSTAEPSPSTSVSSMSPLSDRSEGGRAAAPAPESKLASDVRAAVEPKSNGSSAPSMLGEPVAKSLMSMSHRGYGAPVSSWNNTHSAINRQVFEERRDERKRVIEASDEMDRGRSKKVKKFHHFNRFNNNRNSYNPFQDKQNKPQWNSGGFQYRGDRRPHFKHNNKYKRFNRYGNGHHYPRHH